ncbi:MAG: hypothetical protein L6R30_06530 [Thermoanaerobaculia bacterium]|nr:hypothetical protein [Thermoanaerobaculia bacterium]
MQLLKTMIPFLQPGGTLDVPPDDWVALSQFVEARYGGHIHVGERRFGGGNGHGLPWLELTVEVPDEVDINDLVNGEFNEKLKQTVTTNTHASREPKAT